MSYRSIFDAKYTSVDAYPVFDFSASLAAGETITSASTSGPVYSGTVISALSFPSNSISGGQVTQTTQGGLAGVTYTLSCTAITSASKTLVCEGYLTVKDSGT